MEGHEEGMVCYIHHQYDESKEMIYSSQISKSLAKGGHN